MIRPCSTVARTRQALSSNLAKLCSKKPISKNLKKNLKKKIFFWSWIFWENRHKIAKNWQIDKMKTVSNRQDFGLSRKYFEFLEIVFFLARFGDKNFFENFSFRKELFLIGFTCTNNLSMVLLSSLLKKFLCDMHTHWALTHLKTAVCS